MALMKLPTNYRKTKYPLATGPIGVTQEKRWKLFKAYYKAKLVKRYGVNHVANKIRKQYQRSWYGFARKNGH